MRRFLLPLLAVSSVVPAAFARAEPRSCPPPSRLERASCVLDADIVIEQTLVLEPGTHFDCRGHAILPSGVAPAPGLQSIPEVAVFAPGARAVKVENCVIGSATLAFSWGVVIADTKLAPGADPATVGEGENVVKRNQIRATVVGIALLHADNTVITKNDVTFFGNGFGILLLRRSARNTVSNNQLNRLASDYRPKGVTPGDPILDSAAPGYHNRVASAAIISGRGPSVGPGTVTFSIGGRSVTIPDVALGEVPPRDDNTITENTIRMNGVPTPPPPPFWGTPVVLAGIEMEDGTSGALVHANVVLGAVDSPPNFGVFVGGGIAGPGWVVYDVTISDNLVEGLFGSDALQNFTAQRTIIEGNTLSGGRRSGVLLAGAALMTSVVRRNTISGNGFASTVPVAAGGITLFNNRATHFGAQIELNDITGNPRGVGMSPTYGFATELSVSGRGNYWGHDAAPGFVPGIDSSSPLITDSAPYCQPVSLLDEAALPATCP